MKRGRPWTTTELATLETMWRDGEKAIVIAEALNRTAGAVRCKAVDLSLRSIGHPGGGLGRHWGRDDVARLHQLWLDQTPLDLIASALDRSRAAVIAKAGQMGLPRRYSRVGRPLATDCAAPPEDPPLRRPQRPAKDRPARRPCLTCGRQFGSTGFGNRICNRCRSRGDLGIETYGVAR